LLDAQLGPIVPHLMPIRVLHGCRDRLRDSLTGIGIETGIHYKPNHLLTYFRRNGLTLPVTEQVYSELLSLPLHPGLTLGDVDHVCDSVSRILKTES
jgi:dTDP-4-amino-4,6-dideoxygalactose transaminase